DAQTDRASRSDQVAQARREGRTARADKLIEGLRRDYPAYGDMADCRLLLKQEDFAGAEALARRAVQEAPDVAEAHYVLGLALLGRQDPKGAADSFRQALRLQPDHAAAY